MTPPRLITHHATFTDPTHWLPDPPPPDFTLDPAAFPEPFLPHADPQYPGTMRLVEKAAIRHTIFDAKNKEPWAGEDPRYKDLACGPIHGPIRRPRSVN